MHHVPGTVEQGRLSEYDVLLVGRDFVLNPFDTLEEHKVNGAALVPEGGDQPAPLAFSC